MKYLALSCFLGMVVISLPAYAIKIIVNETNPVTELRQEDIRNYFLKKNKQWPHGGSVRFFDRNDDSPERRIFLRNVIERSPREIETFWIGQKLYSGHSAPTQVSSDSMMSSLVSRFPGGIGYVSKDFTPPKGVKVIKVKSE